MWVEHMLHVLVLIISRNCHTYKQVIIDLFTDTAAILISIVSNSYYGTMRDYCHGFSFRFSNSMQISE